MCIIDCFEVFTEVVNCLVRNVTAITLSEQKYSFHMDQSFILTLFLERGVARYQMFIWFEIVDLLK